MFISNTRRNPYEEQKVQQAAVVQYDVNTNTISDQIKKKAEGGYGNSLLTDLKLKRKINPGFSSNAPRFQAKKVDEAEAFLGPGFYEIKSNFEPKTQTAAP